MENNEEIGYYEEALQKYTNLLHLICVMSILGIIACTILKWYILLGIFIFVAFQGIKRLRWLHELEKRGYKEGFSVAEYIFKDDESEGS